MYKKSPYYHNTNALNNRDQYTKITEELKCLSDLLEDESDIFEIGFGLGERLYTLKNLELDIVGGVEFDPFFGTFGNKHFAVYDNHKIILTTLSEWFDSKHEVYFTYYLLDNFDEPYKSVVLEKILKTAKENGSKVFFIENEEIPVTERKEGVQVYVANNGREVNDWEEYLSESETKTHSANES